MPAKDFFRRHRRSIGMKTIIILSWVLASSHLIYSQTNRVSDAWRIVQKDKDFWVQRKEDNDWNEMLAFVSEKAAREFILSFEEDIRSEIIEAALDSSRWKIAFTESNYVVRIQTDIEHLKAFPNKDDADRFVHRLRSGLISNAYKKMAEDFPHEERLKELLKLSKDDTGWRVVTDGANFKCQKLELFSGWTDITKKDKKALLYDSKEQAQEALKILREGIMNGLSPVYEDVWKEVK